MLYTAIRMMNHLSNHETTKLPQPIVHPVDPVWYMHYKQVHDPMLKTKAWSYDCTSMKYHQSTLLYMTSFSPSTWATYLAAVNRKSLNLYDKWNRYTLVALDSTLALWYCSIEMTLLANMCTSLPEMGVLQLRREGCFSACLCTGGEKWSTLCQSRSF